jgi:hypothetical protein
VSNLRTAHSQEKHKLENENRQVVLALEAKQRDLNEKSLDHENALSRIKSLKEQISKANEDLSIKQTALHDLRGMYDKLE